MLMWILYDTIIALIVNVILSIFLILFLMNAHELHGLLALSDEDATSNKLMQDDKPKSRSSSRSGSEVSEGGTPVQRTKKAKGLSEIEVRESNSKVHKYDQFFDDF